MRATWARLTSYLRRARADRELRAEIESHIRLAADEYERRGLGPHEAQRAARRDFGSIEGTKERYRDQLGLPALDALLQDLRIGARQLRQSPVFLLTACTLLALGIGASTAVYSVVDALLVTPFPGAEPHRRVQIDETVHGRPTGGNAARLRDMQENLSALTAVSGYYGEEVVLTGDGDPRRVPVLRTFGPFLEVIGIVPALGRAFSVVEERGQGEAVALASHAFWQRELGGSADALGTTVELSGNPVTIVGVLPAEMFPPTTDLFIPADAYFQGQDRGARYLALAGRLADGATHAQAQAEMDQLMTALQQEFPDTDEGVGAVIRPLQPAVVGETRTALIALFAVTLCVVMLTCLNLAGLMLARGLRRRNEVAVRVALGASAARVVRLFLFEGLLVALAGGVGGLVVAVAGTRLLAGAVVSATGLARTLSVDWRVGTVGLLLAATSGLLLGAMPAWQAARADAAPTLKEGRVAMGVGSGRLRRFLVGGQVALSVVLLIAAALLTRELLHHVSRPLGFEPGQVLTVKTRFSWSTPASEIRAFKRASLERLAALPGVIEVGLADRLPLEGASQSGTILIRDRDLPPGLEQTRVARRSVSAGYLRTIGVPLLAGEPLRRTVEADTAGAQGRGGDVVVNEAFGDTFFPDSSPVGTLISFRGGAGDRDAEPVWRRIVGVVGNVRREITEEVVPPEAFALYDDIGWPLISFAIATSTPDVATLAGPVRAALAELAPDQVIDSIEPLAGRIQNASAGQRRNAWVMYAFAGLALTLVAVGLYGLVATEVTRRIPELGVRTALGAGPAHIVIEATRHTLVTLLLGAGAGVALGALAAAWVRDVLTAVAPLDPLSIAVALATLAAASTLAALAPIRRALRIDPARALRQE